MTELEPRGRIRGFAIPHWRVVPLGLIQSVSAILIGLAICLAIIALITGDPLNAFSSFIFGTFSTRYAFGSMIAIATVLVLTALSATVGFRAGAFNVGGEGRVRPLAG